MSSFSPTRPSSISSDYFTKSSSSSCSPKSLSSITSPLTIEIPQEEKLVYETLLSQEMYDYITSYTNEKLDLSWMNEFYAPGKKEVVAEKKKSDSGISTISSYSLVCSQTCPFCSQLNVNTSTELMDSASKFQKKKKNTASGKTVPEAMTSMYSTLCNDDTAFEDDIIPEKEPIYDDENHDFNCNIFNSPQISPISPQLGQY